MARFNLHQSSFLSGKISKRNFGRIDLQGYFQACARLENFIPRIQGGIYRRPGTRYLNTPASFTDGAAVRLFPYVASDGDRYILLLKSGETACRQINFETGVESNLSITTAQQTTGIPPLDSGNGQLRDEIQYVQKDSVAWFTHDKMQPLVLINDQAGTKRLHGLTDTALATFADPKYNVPNSYYCIPYRDENITLITLTPSATTGTWSGTGTGVSLTASSALFDESMVYAADATDAPRYGGYGTNMGTIFRIRSGTSYGYLRVEEYVSDTVVRGTVLRTLPGTTAYSTWSESAWSPYRGYPRAVAFFQNRLWFAGNLSEPMKVWASQLGNPFRFSVEDITATIVEDDPFQFQIDTDLFTELMWISPRSDELIVGTGSKELSLAPRDKDLAISATNSPVIREYSSVGSKYLQPIRIDGGIIVAQNGGQNIYELSYDVREQGFKSIPLNYLNDPIFDFSDYVGNTTLEPSIRQWCYQRSHNMVWFLSGNKWHGLVRSRALDISAFSDHTLGGETGDTPIINTMCVLPASSAQNSSYAQTHDVLIMSVTRDVDGVSKHFIEVLGGECKLDGFDDIGSSTYPYFEFAYPGYVDCYYQARTATSGTHAGWSHLEGAEVSVVVDGGYLGEQSVETSGYLTFDSSWKHVIAGFNYTPYLQTVPIEAGSQVGSAQGRLKRIDEVAIRFFKSIGAMFSGDGTNFEEIIFRDPMANIGDAIDPYTGLRVLKLRQDYSQEISVHIKQLQPLPLEITSLTLRGVEYD